MRADQLAVVEMMGEVYAKDLRIAELEGALKRVCDEYQKTLDDMEVGGICASADVAKEFGGDYPTLDRMLAQARREALAGVADRAEERGGMLTDLELRQMAREVKP